MYKTVYIFAWLILGPLAVVVSTLIWPFVLTIGLFMAAKNGWPKVEPNITNYGLTPPPKETIILN